MSILYLDRLFYPRSVAVIGAGQRDGDPGQLVMRNLLHGGFEGPVMPVHAKQAAVCGVLAYPRISDLPTAPDLAVISGEKPNVLAAIQALGERGTRAAVVLTIDTASNNGSERFSFSRAVAAAAAPFGMRVLGPNCMGIVVPHIGLNASIAHVPAQTGSIAFVSQSSAMCAGVLDWARAHDIGFAHFVSLGDTSDVDFADVIDYLGTDAMTRTILLYIETIRNGRAFMSAGRGASRNKPILVIKAGRCPEGQEICGLRVDGPSGEDQVFDAAFRRAGMLRVFSFGELFAAVETLARAKPLRGENLAIVANGYGLATMAADALVEQGGRLARLSAETEQKLSTALSDGTPATNPMRVATDAPPASYATAAEALIAAPEVDAVMVLHVPSAMASSDEAARGVIRVAAGKRANVLTSWMGGASVAQARRRFVEARIPTYDTPTLAINAFMHMVRYRRNQEILMETPSSTPLDVVPATEAAQDLIRRALAAGRVALDENDARLLLAAYGVQTVPCEIVDSPAQAAETAVRLGFPVMLHLPAADLPPEGADDLYRLIDRPEDVANAARSLLSEAADRHSGAKIGHLLLKKWPSWPGVREVRIGVRGDPVFGPMLTFGRGGAAAAGTSDHAVGLPPLNMSLARELVSRWSGAGCLTGDGRYPAVNMETLCLMLVSVSQMIVDMPEIISLDLNPVLVNQIGAIAVDIRARVGPRSPDAERRLAIRPYPKELEEPFTLRSGREVLLRPIRPEDEPAHYEFLSRVNMEDLRYRFFGVVGRMPHTQMARLTQIDYDREMAFVAVAPKPEGCGSETLGVVRTITDPDNEQAEYAILVRSDLKGQRLGWQLLDKMIRYCASRGTRRIVGQVMRDNARMLGVVTDLGFRSRLVPDDDVFEVTRAL